MTKVNQGILQAQFNVKNSIDVHNAFDSEYTGSPLLKSVEGSGEIVLTDTDSFAGSNSVGETICRTRGTFGRFNWGRECGTDDRCDDAWLF